MTCLGLTLVPYLLLQLCLSPLASVQLQLQWFWPCSHLLQGRGHSWCSCMPLHLITHMHNWPCMAVLRGACMAAI